MKKLLKSNVILKIKKIINMRVFIFFSLLFIGFWRILLGSIGTFNWDYPIFLDGIWRVIQGQIPHVDFSTPIGPLTFLIGYLGSIFTDLSIHSFDYGIVVVYFLTTYFTFYWSKNYMNSLPSILLTLLVGSYLITTRIIGYPFYMFGYTSYYNLIGYVFLYIIAINVIFSKKHQKINIWSGGVSGFLVVLSFFIKITFGLGALVFIIIKLLIDRTNIDWWKGFMLGFGICSFSFLYYFNFNVNLVINDYLILIEASGGENNIIVHLIDLLKTSIFAQLTNPHSFILAFIPFISCCLFLYFIYKDTVRREGNFDFLIYVAFLTLLGIALMITVNQPPEFVVGSIVAVLFFNWLNVKKRFLNKWPLFFTKNLSLLIILIALMNNSLSLLVGTYKIFLMDKSRYSTALNDHKTLKGGFFSKNNQITFEFIDGLKMLEPYIKENDKITVLGVNIFSFTLMQNSTSKDLLYWHDGITHSDKTLAKFKKMEGTNIFEETTILMIPLTMINKPTNAINYYQNYIDKNFTLFSQSKYWKMLIKNDITI